MKIWFGPHFIQPLYTIYIRVAWTSSLLLQHPMEVPSPRCDSSGSQGWGIYSVKTFVSVCAYEVSITLNLMWNSTPSSADSCTNTHTHTHTHTHASSSKHLWVSWRGEVEKNCHHRLTKNLKFNVTHPSAFKFLLPPSHQGPVSASLPYTFTWLPASPFSWAHLSLLLSETKKELLSWTHSDQFSFVLCHRGFCQSPCPWDIASNSNIIHSPEFWR